ncbi:MAG: hypothetical protein WCI74_13875 [Actinomycetes bacterium]
MVVTMKGFPDIRELPIPATDRLVMRGDAGVNQERSAGGPTSSAASFRTGAGSGCRAWWLRRADVGALCDEPPLERFASILTTDHAPLLSGRIEVGPTFRVPHVTLAQIDLDA